MILIKILRNRLATWMALKEKGPLAYLL